MKNFRACVLHHEEEQRSVQVIWANKCVHRISLTEGVLTDHARDLYDSRSRASNVFDHASASLMHNNFSLTYLSPVLRVTRHELAHPQATLDAHWTTDAIEWLSDGQPTRRYWMVATGLLSASSAGTGAAAAVTYLAERPHYADPATNTLIGQVGRIPTPDEVIDGMPFHARSLIGATASSSMLCPITPCGTTTHDGRCESCDTRLAELIAYQLRGRDPRLLSPDELARIGDTARRLAHL